MALPPRIPAAMKSVDASRLQGRSIGFTSVCIDEVTLSVKLLHMLPSGFGSAWSPAPPVVWFGVWVCSQSLRPPRGVVWCGSLFGSPWVFRNRRHHHHHHHHHRHAHHHDVPFLGQLPQEAGPRGTAPGDSCMFKRIGCVWDQILVTAHGFGAAMWEEYGQSRGFGIFAYLDLGVPGEGGDEARTGILYGLLLNALHIWDTMSFFKIILSPEL